MAESMTLEFIKGLVRQDGYEEAICQFAKLDDEQVVYLVEDIDLGKGLYAVTPNVSEALKRVERKTVGVIDDNGRILIPTSNAEVIKLNDKLFAVKKEIATEELLDEESKDTVEAGIKSELGEEAEFLLSSEEKFDIYEYDEGKLKVVSEDISYVIETKDGIYTNEGTKNSSSKLIIEKQKKEDIIDLDKPQMPVETFAHVNEQLVDSLEVTTLEDQKEGAPELKDEDEQEESIEDKKDLDEKKEEVEETKESPFKVQNIDVKNNISSIFDEDKPKETPKPAKENKETGIKFEVPKPKSTEGSSNIKAQMADIASLISAARNRVDSLTKENEENEHSIADMEEKIESLEKELDELKKAKARQEEAASAERAKQKQIISELRLLEEHQKEKINLLTNENGSLTQERDSLLNKVDNLEDTIREVYGEVYSAFSGMREDQSVALKKVA